jgi:hypothetical protein
MQNRICTALVMLICSLLAFPGSSSAQDVKLEEVAFQELLDRLFGTPLEPGLLDGDKAFQLHAKDVTLTSEEALKFFVPTEASEVDFADLISESKQIRGAELKISGLIDGEPFELKVSGKQLKADGLMLTQGELDGLIEELQGISTLHEAKLQVMVDGSLMEVKLQNVPGRVRVQNRTLSVERPRADDKPRRPAVVGLERAEIARSIGLERRERIERPERPTRPEIPEGRIERPEVGRAIGRR